MIFRSNNQMTTHSVYLNFILPNSLLLFVWGGCNLCICMHLHSFMWTTVHSLVLGFMLCIQKSQVQFLGNQVQKHGKSLCHLKSC